MAKMIKLLTFDNFRHFDILARKTSDNNDLNQVVTSSGFSENKGWGEGDSQSRGLIKPGLDRSYLRIFFSLRTRSRMTTATTFSRQNDAGLRASTT